MASICFKVSRSVSHLLSHLTVPFCGEYRAPYFTKEEMGGEGGSSISKTLGSKPGSSPYLQLFPGHCVESHAQWPL